MTDTKANKFKSADLTKLPVANKFGKGTGNVYNLAQALQERGIKIDNVVKMAAAKDKQAA